MPTDPSMTDIAGDPNLWPETFRLISGSTRGYADRIAAALEALANRTAWERASLKDDILVPLFQGLVVSRFSPYVTVSPTPQRAGWLQTDVTDAGQIWWHMNIGERITIAGAIAYLDGDDGPGGPHPGLPAAADRPRFDLYRQPTDGSSLEFVGAGADESASLAEYEQHHTMGGTFPTPIALAADEYLLVRFQGEKGVNAVPNALKLYGIRLIPALAPAP